MEIGIDSFAAFVTDAKGNPVGTAQDALREWLDRIQLADEKGLDVLSVGEHHRKEFLDSATSVILAAAAARTTAESRALHGDTLGVCVRCESSHGRIPQTQTELRDLHVR